MNRKRKIPAYLVIALALGFSFYFFISTFLNPQDSEQSLVPSFNQDPNSISTLTSDVDVCVTNPTMYCDQEMLQIKKFCNENRNQNIPVCSDTRVQQYVDQRGLERPIINTGR